MLIKCKNFSIHSMINTKILVTELSNFSQIFKPNKVTLLREILDIVKKKSKIVLICLEVYISPVSRIISFKIICSILHEDIVEMSLTPFQSQQQKLMLMTINF